jgi:hypothetical protein
MMLFDHLFLYTFISLSLAIFKFLTYILFPLPLLIFLTHALPEFLGLSQKYPANVVF